MLKTLLTAGMLTLLTVVMSPPTLADHIRHRDSYLLQGAPHAYPLRDAPRYEHRRWLSSGKHYHRKQRHKAFRHHRAGPPRRFVERHGYLERSPRHDVRRHHHRRRHRDIPLITVDGFPVLRIRIDH